MSIETFWLALTIAALGWYATVTAFVAWRGARDVRALLRRLASRPSTPPEQPARGHDRSDASF